MLDTTRRDQVTVEAETVEDALVEISSELGEDAEIMRAQKVHRGGVGGFFAKEMVQLTARRRRGQPAQLRPKARGAGISGVLERMAQDADAGDGDFRSALRRELAAGPDDSDTGGFLAAVGWQDEAEQPTEDDAPPPETNADVVVDEQTVPTFADESVDANETPEPVAVGPVLQVAPLFPSVDEEPATVDVEPVAEEVVEQVIDPVPVAGDVIPIDFPLEPDFDEAASTNLDQDIAPMRDQEEDSEAAADNPAVDLGAPEGMGAVDWGTTSLLRLGMPAPIVGAVAHLDANDDLGWIESIAAAVEPYCGPLPEGDVIVVGPHAERLAEPLGLPLIQAGEMAPYHGSFCAIVEDTVQDRTWLEFVQGGRGIHLVIGDEPWQDLLVGEPVAVSWVGETAVSDALYLAFTLGSTLGFGTVDGFVSSMVRAQPTDIALAVRRIVGRR